MKSKKKTKKGYSKQEDIKPKDCYCDKCDCVGNYCTCDPDCIPEPTPEPTPTPARRMINRKAIQAEIDIDKSIRRLLDVNYYNDNQIASMIRGANLERVKKVKDERRKNKS